MNADNGVSMDPVPQLRALLFTDLCDSTELVERIGDAAAASLFQQHDKLVLRLQQRWHGQLIDRSDGLFLLFERPINALGFALSYLAGLVELSKSNGVSLAARAGLHVGEVIVWKNAPDAVAVGAKRVEVEGLAKPMAARLMQLALPQQILVSDIAESVMRRAIGSLGAQAEDLKWQSFGRWRFKGVPQSMEVFGVQGAGMPPSLRPRTTQKASRVTPIWRRPAAMVAQVGLLLGIAVTTWFATRPEQAIAFAERDWVVLADVRNMTGQGVLDEGMSQAFRISLDQSRYVNVLGDLKVRDTLVQMMLPEETPIDQAIAIQIAKRDGARAVLLPTIREVSGKVRVSLEVVDPTIGQTVYTLYSDGSGLDSVLPSTDDVVGQLRHRLGEAVAEVRRASEPLPRVATSDLDALYAYSRAQIAYGEGRVPESLRLFDIAIGLDQGFAMAHLGKVRSLVASASRDEAREELAIVEQLKDRLSTRERLYFEAWKKEMTSASETASLDAWRTLADLYPDHHGANANVALGELQLGRYAAAEVAAKRASVSQNGLKSAALQLLGRVQLAREEVPAALATLKQSVVAARGQPNRHLATAMALSGDAQGAIELIKALPAESPAGWLEGRSLDVDTGNTAGAVKAAARSVSLCDGSATVCELLQVVDGVVVAAADQCSGGDDVFRVADSLMRRASDPAESDRGQWLYFAVATLYAGQRSGVPLRDEKQLGALSTLAIAIGDPRAQQLVALVSANHRRMMGDTARAVSELKSLVNGSELYQVHSVLAMALAESGDADGAARELAWLRGHRGAAYAEYAGSSVLQALNVRDSRKAPEGAHCLKQAVGRSS